MLKLLKRFLRGGGGVSTTPADLVSHLGFSTFRVIQGQFCEEDGGSKDSLSKGEKIVEIISELDVPSTIIAFRAMPSQREVADGKRGPGGYECGRGGTSRCNAVPHCVQPAHKGEGDRLEQASSGDSIPLLVAYQLGKSEKGGAPI